ncbi:hypothetical protein AA0117_g11301 [Alternaria alternata]|uniref:Uncharacterized protein n=1 Tax=Alternaria alternata TaxID=5599 RepID=A0A4Q4N263_ALTAL|nr:hypothetical protein AA0117_g11301 [Alternaria alternata]
MAPYVPKEYPQERGWKLGGDASDAHETELCKNGPAPPNYLVERRLKKDGKYNIRYTELSGSPQTSKRAPHPFSAESLQKNPTPKIAKEFDLNRPDYRGVFHVPITYKAGPEIKWQFSGSPARALAAALAARGVKCKHGDLTKVVTEADVKATFASVSAKEMQVSDNHKLYHPADRNSLVFPDEVNIAIAARAYKHSLVLFCPFMNADRTGYNHFYNTENRPPIYARGSTGRQASFPPVVLGCLPKFKLPKNPTFEVMWFSIDVDKGVARPTWHRCLYHHFNSGLTIKGLAEGFGFPMKELEPSVFLWTLVSLHRRRVLGTHIPDDHLACWIWQFSEHLVEKCKPWTNPHPSPFQYDNTKLAAYKAKYPEFIRLNFQTLTALILNPNMTSKGKSILQYAWLWNEAIDAQVQCLLDDTDANLAIFQSKMEAARKLPF